MGGDRPGSCRLEGEVRHRAARRPPPQRVAADCSPPLPGAARPGRDCRTDDLLRALISVPSPGQPDVSLSSAQRMAFLMSGQYGPGCGGGRWPGVRAFGTHTIADVEAGTLPAGVSGLNCGLSTVQRSAMPGGTTHSVGWPVRDAIMSKSPS
jgi:hypothetical protein